MFGACTSHREPAFDRAASCAPLSCPAPRPPRHATARVQAAIKALPPQEAEYHMKRCADSGLWVPEGGAAEPPAPQED